MYSARMLRLWLLVCVSFFSLTACFSYQRRLNKVETLLYEGRKDAALAQITKKEERAKKGQNRLLFYLNAGAVNWLAGNYKACVEHLNQAEIIANELYFPTITSEALGVLVNPNLTPYRGDAVELQQIHVYKIISFLMMQNQEAALVEARKLTLVLQRLDEKKYTKNYRSDGFANLLIGLVYEQAFEDNNAFIAYRNAYNSYQNNAKEAIDVNAPIWLEDALIRTSYQLGFMSDYDQFSASFGKTYTSSPKEKRRVDVLYLTGLAPAKDQWSINFVVQVNNNRVHLFNADLGFSFFYDVSEADAKNLKGLSLFRIAMPRYVERSRGVAQIKFDDAQIASNFSAASNLSDKKFFLLREDLTKDLSVTLLRFALKKAQELAVSKENKDLGTAVSVLNFITESADTRSWLMLPKEIGIGSVWTSPSDTTVSINLQIMPNQNTEAKVRIVPLNRQTGFAGIHHLYQVRGF